MDVMDLEEYSSPEKVAKLGEIDQEFVKTIVSQPPLALDLRDIPALRDSLSVTEDKLIDALPPLPPTFSQTKIMIPCRDGHRSESILVYPVGEKVSSNGVPILVIFHGGGWALGSPLQLLPYAHGLAKLLSCAVLLPSYRLAPEHPFPTGILDAWDALNFASKSSNFESIAVKIDHKKGFVLGGNSAGGNFAGILTQKAKDESLNPPLTGQFMGYPSLISGWSVPEKYRSLWFSAHQHADGPLYSQNNREVFEALAKIDLRSPLASPLNTKEGKREDENGAGINRSSTPLKTFLALDGEERHNGLPKAFFQICGMDPVRDDALVYARILRDSAVETKVVCYKGLPHGWWNSYPQMEQSRKACGDVARGYAWLLNKKKGEWRDDFADEVMSLPAIV